MEKYDYLEAVKSDILDYIKWNNITVTESNLDELRQSLNDELWTNDSVTGNASGSYTFNYWRAEEYLAHNWDLLMEALEEFGYTDISPIEKGAEWCDVTIRCHLLAKAIDEVLDSIELEPDNDDLEIDEDKE